MTCKEAAVPRQDNRMAAHRGELRAQLTPGLVCGLMVRVAGVIQACQVWRPLPSMRPSQVESHDRV